MICHLKMSCSLLILSRWKPIVVFNYCMVSVTSLDVLEKQTTETALVAFILFSVHLNSITHKPQLLLFFHKIMITQDWRRIHPVYLSMPQKSFKQLNQKWSLHITPPLVTQGAIPSYSIEQTFALGSSIASVQKWQT